MPARLLDPLARAGRYLRAKATQPPRDDHRATVDSGRGLGWHVGDLRRLVEDVCDWMQVSRLRFVRVVSWDRDYSWGQAALPGRGIMLKLPRALPGRRLDVEALARLLVHEVQHNLGLEHHEMSSGSAGRYHCGPTTVPMPGFVAREVRNLSREEPPPAPPPSPELSRAARTVRRETAARAALERALHALELAEARVARWRKKVAYYDRKSRRPSEGQGIMGRSVPSSGPGAPPDLKP